MTIINEAQIWRSYSNTWDVQLLRLAIIGVKY